MLKDQIISELQKAEGRPISGQSLADSLSVSRNAIWKAVHSLQNEGCPIFSHGRRGYYLISGSDLLSETLIREYLASATRAPDIRILASIDSTNTEALRILASLLPDPVPDAGLAVLADEQTAGRGKWGTSYYSPRQNGLYFSYALPTLIPLGTVSRIIPAISQTVQETIRRLTGLETELEGKSTLLLGGKKMGGILTEIYAGDLEAARTSMIIIGIGLNMSEKGLPQTVQKTRSSLENRCSRNALAASLIDSLQSLLYRYIQAD